jgi:hypothetical protein
LDLDVEADIEINSRGEALPESGCFDDVCIHVEVQSPGATHPQDNVFGFEGSLFKRYNEQLFSRIEAFTNMTDEEVEGIEYRDKEGRSNEKVPTEHK